MPNRIQLRRGNATEWTTANPVLAEGEICVELDTEKFKIGNGVDSWNQLAYSSGPPGIQGDTGTQGVSITDAEIVGNQLEITLSNNTVVNAGNLFAASDLTVSTSSAGTNSLTYSNGVFTFTPTNLSSYALTTAIPTNNNQLSNGSGYITSITSSTVTTALGFTPYDATNPTGFITTAALTAYALTSAIPTNNNQLTNGSGYITTASLTGYALTSSLATVSTSGSYTDLSNTPTVGTIAAQNANAVTLTGGTITGTTISLARINPRVTNIASSATITPPSDTADQYSVTALAVPATIAIPSGTPVAGQKLTLRIKDDGTARALTWTASAGGYRVIGSTLPTTTVISKTVYVGCIYNATESFWDVVAVAQQA